MMYVHLYNTSELCHGNLSSFTSNARWRSHPVIFTHHKFTLKSAKVRIVYSLGEPSRKILNYTVVAHSIGNVKKQAAGHALVQPPTDRTAASYWHEERASGTHTDAPQVKPHHTVKLGQLLCIMSDINNPCTMNTVKLEHESRKEIVRLFLSMTCTSYSTCYVPVHVSTHHMY